MKNRNKLKRYERDYFKVAMKFVIGFVIVFWGLTFLAFLNNNITVQTMIIDPLNKLGLIPGVIVFVIVGSALWYVKEYNNHGD